MATKKVSKKETKAKAEGKAVVDVAKKMSEKKVTAANVGFTKANNPDGLIQRTLIIFKPDAVQRGIVGEILSRFERSGFEDCGDKNGKSR